MKPVDVLKSFADAIRFVTTAEGREKALIEFSQRYAKAKLKYQKEKRI